MESLKVSRENKAKICNAQIVALSSSDVRCSVLKEVDFDQVGVNIVIENLPSLERVVCTDVNTTVSIHKCHQLKEVIINGKVKRVRIRGIYILLLNFKIIHRM